MWDSHENKWFDLTKPSSFKGEAEEEFNRRTGNGRHHTAPTDTDGDYYQVYEV